MRDQKLNYFVYGAIAVILVGGLYNTFIKNRSQTNSTTTNQRQSEQCVKAIQHVNDYNLSVIYDDNKGGRISTPSGEEDTCAFLMSPTPSPSVPFSLKQECAQDTYSLLNQLNIGLAQNPNQASYTLSESTFSNKLNTCIADIEEIQTYNGQNYNEEYIYDTVSQKILSQYNNNNDNDSTNFTQDKLSNTNGFDVYKYSVSIGLSE